MLEMVSSSLADHAYLVWTVWSLVSATLVVAAVIDGWKLKVPNYITFPMITSGWAASAVLFGWAGLGCSLAGTAVGLALLMPAYAIGGMGAGDVKLLAGVGAWLGMTQTFWAFVVSAFVGAVVAVLMVLYHRRWKHHQQQFFHILTEIFVVRNATELSTIAAGRKSTMMLLPYGIPIAMGTIGYFVYQVMAL